MRFADLLGEPDDDGNAPGSSTTEGPGVPASGAGTPPAGASGSFGGASAPASEPSTPMDDDLARWFDDEAAAFAPVEPVAPAPGPTPEAPPARGQALAAATGALDAPETDPAPVDAEAAGPPASGVARDDLLPARPSGHGRRRR